MNVKISLNTFGIIAPLIAALCGQGCSSVGYKTGDSTATSLDKASRCVSAETQALNDTINSLAELVSTPAADLKPQFKSYRASLDRLVDSVEKTDRSIVKLRRQSARYLDAWNGELAEMNYQIIRDSSEARRTAVSNQLETVCRRYEETQDVVKPFISYFADIERSLGTDLTVEGLASTRDVARRAEENTRKVQAALEQLSNELTTFGMRLSSVAPANATTAAATSNVRGAQARASDAQ